MDWIDCMAACIRRTINIRSFAYLNIFSTFRCLWISNSHGAAVRWKENNEKKKQLYQRSVGNIINFKCEWDENSINRIPIHGCHASSVNYRIEIHKCVWNEESHNLLSNFHCEKRKRVQSNYRKKKQKNSRKSPLVRRINLEK